MPWEVRSASDKGEDFGPQKAALCYLHSAPVLWTIKPCLHISKCNWGCPIMKAATIY